MAAVSPLARLAAVLLLAGSLLIGLAHVVVLPPWEGFDEPAHYSYIEQFAETGRWPRYGEMMSREIDAYLRVAPTASSLTPAGATWTYQSFAAAQAGAREAGRAFIHAPRPVDRRWEPGEIGNWQAQHPPLYYALMAPAYALSKGWSLAHQLALLRGLSYLIAWGGLCIAAAATLRMAPPPAAGRTAALLAIALWPALFPMWFPEMARLGNDSLLVPIAAGAAVLVAAIAASPRRLMLYAALGAVLGLGLLTKATVLPLAVAVAIILALPLLRLRQDPAGAARVFAGLVVLGALALAIGGWWYAGKYLETGNLLGANDVARMDAQQGLIAGLKDADWRQLARLPWVLVQTFLWAGTWSFVFPPRLALFALVATSGIVAIAAAAFMRREGAGREGWLALLALALFLAGLIRHALVLASIGTMGGGAWYLHAIAPALAVLVAFGLSYLARLRHGGAWLAAVLIWPLAFLALATAIDALFFAGCGTTLPNLRYFDLASAAPCATDFAALYRNLAILSLPAAFVLLFAVGFVLCLAGTLMALKALTASTGGRRTALHGETGVR